MKPDFALSLSLTGISLFARTPAGWEELGTVSLASDDMADELRALRQRAEGQGGQNLLAKVVLPDAHLFFTTLKDGPQTRVQVLEALDGLTPYPAEALVIDYQPSPLGTDVAAVTRLTLAEAETFAKQHGFTPASFAAVAPDGLFGREVFFGPSKSIGPGFDLGPDPEPVPAPGKGTEGAGQITPELARALAESAARPLEDVQTEDVQTEDVQTLDADPSEDHLNGAATADPVTEPDADDAPVFARARPAKDVAEVPGADDDGTTEDDADDLPKLTFRHRATRVIRPDPITAPVAVASAVPDPDNVDEESTLPMVTFTSASRVVRRTPAPMVSAPSVAQDDAEPVFAHHRAVAAAEPVVEPETAPEPTPVKDPRPKVEVPELVARRLAQAVAATPKGEAAAASSGWPLPDSQGSAAPATDGAAATPAYVRPFANTPHAPRPAPIAGNNRASGPGIDLTSQSSARKPLPLGLFGAVLGMLVISVLGAWALMSDSGLSRLWGGSDPVATAPVDTTDPAEPAAPTELASAADNAAPVAELSALPQDSAPVEPAAAPETTVPPAATGQILSPSEAQLIYAATGVWQRAPRLPDQLPRSSAAPALTPASAVPDFAPAPATLLAAPALTTDATPRAVAPPPPPGVRLTLDARGLIPATPEGIVSLAGAQVFLGRPEVIPPTRPGTAPVPAPEAEAPTGPVPVLGPALGDIPKPQLRPGTPVVAPTPAVPEAAPDETAASAPQTAPTEADAPAAPAATEPPAEAQQPTGPLVSGPALGDIPAPRLRPGTPEPAQPQDATADAPVAAAPAGPLISGPALVDLPRPLVRPGTPPAPEATSTPQTAAPTPAEAQAAIAEALSVLGAEVPTTPTQPAGAVAPLGARPLLRPAGLRVPAPAPVPVIPRTDVVRPSTRPDGLVPTPAPVPEVQDQAQIVPEDPTASATAQAVSRSILPNSRPRGFERTVARVRQAQAQAVAQQVSRQSQGQAQTQSRGTAPQQVSVASVRPTGPVNATVAARATQKNAFNLRRTSLMGVFGSTKNRRALVRLSNGRLVKVKVGDRLDGGRVTAIDTSSLRYQKSGRSVLLKMP